MTTKTAFLATWFAFGILVPLAAQNYSVFISDAGNFDKPPWQILKFDANGQNGHVFTTEHLAWPQDIFFLDQENAVLVSNLNNGRISKYNAATGAFTGEFATGIGGPTRMRLGPDSLLYVLQWQGNGKVWRYQLNGAFVDEFTAVGVPTSIGLDWDTAGNLYVSSYNGRYVRKFSPTGADLGKFVSTNLAGPTNIWFEPNGDLLVIDYNGGAVKRFDSQGNFKGVFITALPQGEGVGVLPDGRIVIGCGGASSVRVYDAAGSLLNDLVPSGTLGLRTPNAVVFHPAPVSAIRELYLEKTLLSPSAGVVFRLADPEALRGVQALEVYTAAGVFVGAIPVAGSGQWDASGLPAGIYRVMARLPDGTVARQTVAVQQ